MSANPANANLGVPEVSSGRTPHVAPPAYYAPGREALQALLAFSSLHAQIRQRRLRQIREHTQPEGAEFWGPEQFVLDEVLQLVSERALAITGSDGIAIALTEGKEIRCRASAGRIAPDPGVRLDPNSGFSGACLRTGLIVRCDDSEKDPRVDREACRRMGLRSIVAVPLMTERGVIGLLEAFCSEPFGFNDSDVRSLSLLGELILAALRPEEDAPSAQPPAEDVRPNGRQTMVETPTTEAPKRRIAGSEPQKVEVGTPEPARFEAATIEPVVGSPLTASAEVLPPPVSRDAAGLQEAAELPNMQSLRDALARVTEVSSQIPPAEPDAAPQVIPGFPFAQSLEPQSSKRAQFIIGIALLVLAGLGLAAGGVWWWQIHHSRKIVQSSSSLAPMVDSPATSGVAPSTSAGQGRPAPGLQQGQGKDSLVVTGIRHWSSADSSSVAIDLQSQVQYEAHRLTNPDRIYFDLHDTTLAGGLPGAIEVGDALLVRIRVAQPSPDITRVVLETRDSPNFSVSMESNPYRLVVEIRSLTAKAKSGKLNLFAPASEGTNQRSTVASLPGSWLQPSVSSGAENLAARPRSAKLRIVLDAGHGGWDMGTVGRRGLLEKNLVLDIVARLGNLVSSRLGAEVIYTRRDDTYIPLEQRTEAANLSQADLFLSVHGNYSDLLSARGVETYYTNTFSSAHAKTQDGIDTQAQNVALADVDLHEKVQQSRAFAERVQQSLYRALLKKDKGTRDRGVKEASYVVLTGTTMPAILAEVSFVSSPTDEARMENPAYRQEIAEGLYKGVAAYAGNARRVNLASASLHPAGQ